jgi:hypothetical protein
LYQQKEQVMKHIRHTTLAELKSALREGEVRFAYTKKDKSIREAKGTLKIDLMTKKPGNGTNYAKDAGYCIYFDTEKDGFRCFAESQLLGIIED